MKIVFKNMTRSEFIEHAIEARVDQMREKFPDLQTSRIHVTVEMDNSPLQPGPDLFKLSLHVENGRYKDVRTSKSSQNIYHALAELHEHLLERFNRFGDRGRVKERRLARRIQKLSLIETNSSKEKIPDYIEEEFWDEDDHVKELAIR